MLLKIVNHLQIDLSILICIECQLADKSIKILDKVAEHGYFGFLLDEGDGSGNNPLLGLKIGGIVDALVDEGEAR